MALDKENNATYLASNLRLLRKALNFSQEELAGKVGLNRGNIASYENGSAEPRICNLIKIATLFRVSIIDLTQRDLRKIKAKSGKNLQDLSAMVEGDRKRVEEFMRKAEEIETVFKSLHNCCRFKTKTLGEVPRDMQILLMNFEQLHEAAQTLLCEHKALLDYIDDNIEVAKTDSTLIGQ